MTAPENAPAVPVRTDASLALWAIAILLETSVGAITTNIEILNTRTEGYLPRVLPQQGYHPKWRYWWWENEEMWRQTLGPKDERGNPVARALTPTEGERMRRDASRAKAMNSLRSAVQLGLWNYLMIPALVVFAYKLRRRTQQRAAKYAASTLLLVALVSAGLMFYRGYYTSLGW